MGTPCSDAEARTRRFLSDGLAPAERAAHARHLAECAPCKADYHAAVEAAAAVGHRRRIERAALTRELRRRELAPLRLAAPAPSRRRRANWRPLVYCAALAVLVLHLGRPHAGPRLVPEAGVVRAGARELTESVPLVQGEVVHTAADGRALLRSPRARAVLGPDTRVLVERVGGLRLRLFAGRLAVRGPLVVATAGGVVSIPDGSTARVETGDALSVACGGGSVSIVTPTGVVALDKGEHFPRTP